MTRTVSDVPVSHARTVPELRIRGPRDRDSRPGSDATDSAGMCWEAPRAAVRPRSSATYRRLRLGVDDWVGMPVLLHPYAHVQDAQQRDSVADVGLVAQRSETGYDVGVI